MNSPDFLIIGGMKCGSTTLFDDLRSVNGVSFPHKEIGHFTVPRTAEEDERYRALFTSDSSLVGDCSTTYTMSTVHSGVADRAAALLGDQTPLVYMVRNPIERAISHHHHLQARGVTTATFEAAIESHPEIVAHGRYEVEASVWIDLFGPNKLLPVPLDLYRSDSGESLGQILGHIGLQDIPHALTTGHSNVTAEARVFTGRSRRLMESRAFQTIYVNGIRRFTPEAFKQSARKALLPAPPRREAPPSRETLETLASIYEPTAMWVSNLTGHRWDLAATLDKILEED